MHKRGQLSESVVHSLVVLFVTSVVLSIGYYSFVSVENRICKTGLSKLQLDVKGIDRELGTGSVEKKSFEIPCDAEEVYFVDYAKTKAEYFSNPLIRDAIASGTEKNVFVVKKGKVEGSFYAGELQLAYPGYSCLVPKSGAVEVFAEGKGEGVDIIPGCYQVECTLIPQKIPTDEAQQILNEFFNFDCERCPTDVLKDVQDYQRTLENLNVYRRYTYCPDTGFTKVEIIISPKEGVARNFRYYEYIPKECVDDLNAYLESLTIEGEVFVQDDPLLMWQFDEVAEETIIEYTLNKSMAREDCNELIQGLGIAEMVQEEEVEDALEPEIDNLPDQTLTINQGETEAFSLNDYVNDDTTLSGDICWEIVDEPQYLEVDIDDAGDCP
jgi:hypothetical protein